MTTNDGVRVDKLAVLNECARSWPWRPKLEVSEWPCTREELDRIISETMDGLWSLMMPEDNARAS